MPHDFRTILCPTDFSETSYHAAEYGLRFAKLSGGTLLLVHVLHNPTGELFHPEGYVLSFDQARGRARKLLEELRDRRLGGYERCELLVEIGDPFTQLMGIATGRHADLVVIGTRGSSGLQHLIMGSVAEKIIRHAPCPVFVMRRGVD
jgi:universal stress protein A